MMCVNTSCHLKENLFIDLAKTFADVQNGGVLDEFVSVINKVAKKYDVSICDREFHYYTAIKLLETIFDL